MTGGELVVPQITSSRFLAKAKFDGVVTDVKPGETMTVQYNNGDEETIDIQTRKSRTKRGAYIALELNPLPVGTKFKKNQLLASTKNFDNTTSCFMSGKNVTIAVMSYLGYTYEDGYAISDKLANNTTTDTVREVSIIVPPETKVFHVEGEIGKKTESGEDLVEFSYEEDLSNYMLANEFDVDDDELEGFFGEGDNTIKLKSPGGEIIDIKVYVNDKMKSDPQLIKLHKALVSRMEDIHHRLLKGKNDKYSQLTASDNLDTAFYRIGGHKTKGQEFRGIKVTYLIKSPKPLRVGDKCAPRFGAKGLIAKIYEDGSATAPTTGNIDVFISPVSVIGRKNLAFLKELYLGKLTKTLRDRVTSMAQNSKVKTDTIIKFVLDYYKLICSENTYKSVEKKLSDMTVKQARDFFLEPNMNICTIIEPFQDVTFDAIRTAAKMLKVPLDEYVTIKTEDGRVIKTDRPVPVGISYFQFLEHFSSQYTSVGGAVKYNPISKQPQKIGGGGNVATIGNLDITALLTYDTPDMLEELLTARSDHHKIKRKLYTSIANTGELYDITEDDKKMDKSGGTLELKNIYMQTLGLMIH